MIIILIDTLLLKTSIWTWSHERTVSLGKPSSVNLLINNIELEFYTSGFV